ncbi:F-box domain-containing protein [Apiospora rasikravindrae]|uniref:F-box domain-containing protein n=1 Tax=Apiospora rasikravindrae TaxID=990691 RepID=A0ABR1TAM8_9PEZI
MQNATWPVSRLTCGFCGFVNPHLNTGAATWAPYYRAVYCTGDPDDVDPTTTTTSGTTASATIGSNRPQLSGVGYHQVNSAENTVPPLAHQRYNDPDLDPSTCVTIRDIRPPGPDVPPEQRAGYAWGFLFHDACWALLEQALKPDDMNVAAPGAGNGNSMVIEALWRVLQSVPCGTELPNWGHNYGGLYMGTVKDQCKGEHFVLMGPNSNLVIPSTYANPFRIPEVQKIIASLRIRQDDVTKGSVAARTVGSSTPTAASDETPPSTERNNSDVASPNGSTTNMNDDPFARLPQELRELILCYLATPDVANLRAASREIAGLPLSQPFFRSRFWPGRELHVFFDAFLLPTAEMRNTDWARLYRHLKTNLRYNKVGLGERNRLRIWAQTVRPLAEAMRVVNSMGLLRRGRGHRATIDSDPKSRWWNCNAEQLMMDWKAIKTARCRAPEDFGELGRVLHRAEVELPANQPVRGIYVSLVPFFGSRYISGLRFVFEQSSSSGDVAADVELGYVLREKKQQQHHTDTGCEEYLSVNGETLVGFYAAIDECGFRAMSLLTAKNTMSEYVDWVGGLGALPAVAIKTRGGGLRRVRAAFDVSVPA